MCKIILIIKNKPNHFGQLQLAQLRTPKLYTDFSKNIHFLSSGQDAVGAAVPASGAAVAAVGVAVAAVRA